MKRAAILGAAGRDFHNFRLSSAVITILKSSPFVPVNEKFAHLLDAAADGEVIVSGRDNQVRPDNATFRTHLVVMNQATARRLDHPHSLQQVHTGGSAHVRFKNVRVCHRRFSSLQRVHNCNQSSIVIGKCAVRR